jgi:hypothetical protein
MVQKRRELETSHERMSGLIFDIEYSSDAIKHLANSAEHSKVSLSLSRYLQNYELDIEHGYNSRKSTDADQKYRTASSATDSAAIIRTERWRIVFVHETLIHNVQQQCPYFSPQTR